MKTLKINFLGLQEDVNPASFSSLSCIKVTREQALSFKSGGSFDALLCHYGAENELKPGEEYSGYCIKYCAGSFPFIMDGKFEKGEKGMLLLPRQGQESCFCRKIFNFQAANFKYAYEKLWYDLRKYLDFESTLRKKIMEAMVQEKDLILTDEEYNVLRMYSDETFQQAFSLVE